MPPCSISSPAKAVAATEERVFFNYGWISITIAALLMLATLPGRTQGLGLITEPLLRDLHLDRVDYAAINLWATLLGAAFCFPAGYLVDRLGSKLVATALVLLLAGTVWQMSVYSGGPMGLFILLLFTRAFGQSALSVASITVAGRSFGKRLGPAMGVYSFLLSAFFVVAFVVVGAAVSNRGWRIAWQQIAIALAIGIAPVSLLFLRGDRLEKRANDEAVSSSASLSLPRALKTPAFWIFGLAAAMFNLVSSGLGLFNEAVLAEHGFDQAAYHNFLAVTTLFALVGQLACGWMALRRPFRTLMAIGLFIYTAALLMLPFIKTFAHLWIFAALVGGAAGFITVVFFSIWGQAFGRAQLGRIQGAAQLLTVVSSAVGPLLFAKCAARTGSYTPALMALAAVVFVLAVLAWRVSLPALEVNRTQVQ